MRYLRWSASGIILLIFLAGISAAFGLSWDEPVFARQVEPREYSPKEKTDNSLEEAEGESSHISSHEAIPQVITRTISSNAGGFLFDADSSDLSMSTYLGLVWAANSSERAGFYIQQPSDWEASTSIKVKITFALGGNQAGTVNWRLRLNTYTPNSGEWLTNPASRDADAIVTFPDGPSWYRIYSQTFTIPAEDFQEEPYWSFFFSRGDGSNGEVFPGNLYVMGVDIDYQALLPADYLYLPIIVR